MKSYLNNRKFRVFLRGSFSQWSHASSGVPQGSVLGPTLFNVFINDLPTQLRYCLCLLFADDLKVFRTITSDSDYDLIQSDLNAIARWAADNRMSFNITKSAVLHIGFNNPQSHYFINGESIQSKDAVKDLGVFVDNKLKFHQQSAAAAKKAISTANFIFKSFNYLNTHLFSKLYKVFVRPNLEYCIQSWRPYHKKAIDILEKTQRKITKWCPGLSHLPYETRLQHLKLPSITNRFNRGDMIETFNILKDHYNIPQNNLFTLATENRTRGHDLKLTLPKFSSDIRKFFFVNRVVNAWNKRPDLVISSTSITQFKQRFDTFNFQ